MVKTIIFDYDGTIHQTLGIYEPAFRETYQWLTEQKVAEEQKIASSKIAGWLGLNSKEMWDTFMPELDQKYKDQASKMVGERMIEHYRANKCDPRGKSLVFSDGLTVPRIIELYRRFHRRIGIGFGIGTNLMNDLGPQPLNIVVKMVRANGQPVAKISDNPVKGMCDDPTYLAYLRQVFGMPDKSVP